MALSELALFAGCGGGILGGQLVGFRTVCAVEVNPYRIATLLQRQADGCLSEFPVWDDIRTFDGRHWKGDIDVVTGGFPCTDISCAGKGEGITGKNSRLFFEMLRVIEEVRPRFILSENAKELRTKGLGAVLTGLARLGYDARWGVLGARHVGANHHRKRMWVVATDTNPCRKRSQSINAEMEGASSTVGVAAKLTNADCIGNEQGCLCRRDETATLADAPCKIWPERKGAPVSQITDWWDLPRFTGVDDGGPNRVDRIGATGDMQVPAVAALAWEVLNA